MPSLTSDRISGLSTSVAIKAPVKVAATTNVTQSGEQTIDGVACVDGDRVLCAAQTSSIDNGIWEVRVGAWNRAPDLDGARDIRKGTMVWVAYGDTYAGDFFQVSTADPITVGLSGINFQVSQVIGTGAVAIRDADLSVTVGTGGDFSTINDALGYLSRFSPAYQNGSSSVMGTITLLSGFVWAEQVFVNALDLGWITIVSQDATVPCARSALTLSANQVDVSTNATLPNRKFAIFGYSGAVLPRWGILLDVDQTGTTDANYVGILLHGGAHSTVLSGRGVINVVKPGAGRDGRGINVTHGSTATGWASVWSGCQIGMRISNASKASFRSSVAIGCQIALDVNGVTEVSCQDSNFSGAVGPSNVHAIWASGASSVKASGCDLTDCGIGGTADIDFSTVLAEEGAIVDVSESNISGGQRGIESDSGAIVVFDNGSCASMAGVVLAARGGGSISASGATISGCESQGCIAVFAGGKIIATGASITNNPNVSGLYAYGGEIVASGATITGSKNSAGDFDIRVRDGGEVYAYEANTTNGGGTSVAKADTNLGATGRFNDRTAAGVIWTSDASILNGSKTHDFGSLADGAGETTTVTVTGAALGDFVEGVSLSVDLQGMTLTGYVSAADTVSVRLLNESGGGPIDLASATLRARVRKA
jgi:hypothetical protein